jgi:hypothetical protein
MNVLRILGCIGLLVMCGCGGGGDEGTTLGTLFPTTPTIPTKAVITVGIPSLPAGKSAGAVSFKIQLPAGVTPAVFSGTDASGSVSVTGGNSGSLSVVGYDPAANTITFGSISLSGSGTGDFLVINCLLGSNTTVTASDFTLHEGSVFDTDGVSTGVTPTISVVFR